MGLREFNLTSIIPGVNAWASEKGRTILLDETTTNQNCSRLFPQGLKEVLHRSEEHTSELQSQSNLVCRLLLEKKYKPRRPNRGLRRRRGARRSGPQQRAHGRHAPPDVARVRAVAEGAGLDRGRICRTAARPGR